MIRTTTPTHKFVFPFEISSYCKEVQITYAQGDTIKLVKSMADLQINGKEAIVVLTQQESKCFESGYYYIQAKIVTFNDAVAASRIIRLSTADVLNSALFDLGEPESTPLLKNCFQFSFPPNNEGFDMDFDQLQIIQGGSQFGSQIYDSLDKIDDYIYTIDYSTLDYDYAKKYFETSNLNINPGMCSAVRSGDIFGRNLDWYYNNSAEFVVYTKKSQNHYATYGIANGINELTNNFVDSRQHSDMYKLVPFFLADGKNEKGVFCCINVVNADNGRSDIVTPTVEERDRICALMLPRYILDNFDSAYAAIDYISKYVTLYHPSLLTSNNYELHMIVGDADETYVIEFINHKLVWKKHSILTNFYINNVEFNADGTVCTPATAAIDGKLPSIVNKITKFGSGLERYNLIVNAYNSAKTVSGMRTLMNDLMYTRCYKSTTLPLGPSNPFWYTEFVGHYNETDYTVDSSPAELDTIANIADSWYLERTRDDTPSKTWQTVHSSVYDLKNDKLYLICQEKINKEFIFNFKHYYTASEVDELVKDVKVDANIDDVTIVKNEEKKLSVNPLLVGGYIVIQTLDQRGQIPIDLLKVGTRVYVNSTKLTYEWTGTNWSRAAMDAIASKEIAGLVKVGENLIIDEDGKLSVRTTDEATKGATEPITSNGVHNILGNINYKLDRI